MIMVKPQLSSRDTALARALSTSDGDTEMQRLCGSNMTTKRADKNTLT